MEKNSDSEEYFNFLEGCYQNPVVLVEISSVCNFKCVYCVSRLKKREKGFMSQELFEHIVQQLPKITHYPVRLHIDGEPTIHPKFYEFGKLLNQKGIPFVVALTIIASNGPWSGNPKAPSPQITLTLW